MLDVDLNDCLLNMRPGLCEVLEVHKNWFISDFGPRRQRNLSLGKNLHNKCSSCNSVVTRVYLAYTFAVSESRLFSNNVWTSQK